MMSEWQDIETAPKDDRILAWDKLEGRYVIEWRGGRWGTVPASLKVHEPTLWHPLPDLPTTPVKG